jgi:hypothetical protein
MTQLDQDASVTYWSPSDTLQDALRELETWAQQLQPTQLDDPPTLIDTLETWQDKLTQIDEHIHLLWCFTPELVLLAGPTQVAYPITPWLEERLQGIQLFRMEAEILQHGSLDADTILTVRKDGWRIYLRQESYSTPPNKPPIQQAQHALNSLFDEEDAILWRQELNLAHEWGHLFTEAHIPYQEPLLEALSQLPPETGIPLVFPWFEALLEGLAEATEDHGALAFLCNLGQNKDTQLIACALLGERIAEYTMPSSSSLKTIHNTLLHAIFHYKSESFSLDRINETIGTTIWTEEWEAFDWVAFEKQLEDLTKILQEHIISDTKEIPIETEANNFLSLMEESFSKKTKNYPLDLHEKKD